MSPAMRRLGLAMLGVVLWVASFPLAVYAAIHWQVQTSLHVLALLLLLTVVAAVLHRGMAALALGAQLIVTAIFQPSFVAAQVQNRTVDCSHNMQAISLAVQAWQQQQGRLPDSLEFLDPYPVCPALEVDTYRYESSGTRYTIRCEGAGHDLALKWRNQPRLTVSGP